MGICERFCEFARQEDFSVEAVVYQMEHGADIVLKCTCDWDFWSRPEEAEVIREGQRLLRDGQESLHRVLAAFFRKTEGRPFTRDVMDSAEFSVLWDDVIGPDRWWLRDLFVHRFGRIPEGVPQECGYAFWYGE